MLKEEARGKFCQKLLFVNIITYHSMYMYRCYMPFHVCTVVFRGNFRHVFISDDSKTFMYFFMFS